MSIQTRPQDTPQHAFPPASGGPLQVRSDDGPVAPVRGGRAADLDAARVMDWWEGFRDQLLHRSQELREVGAPLAEAAQVTTALLEKAGAVTPGDVFDAMARGFVSVPGIPTLLATWFTEFTRSGARPVGTRELAEAARAGLVATQRAGAPAPGRGSLLDAMVPAAEALAGAAVAGVPAMVALQAGYRAAADGCRATGERGFVDPGALAVAWFFERGTVV
ncbi:MAG: DAK2 domain-containing protein [Janthinobacterium lividum]